MRVWGVIILFLTKLLGGETHRCTGLSSGLVQGDCDAYVDFFDASNGTYTWQDCERFDPCACQRGYNWMGCKGGRLVSFHAEVSCTLPPSFTNLGALTDFTVWTNLYGTLPTELGHLSLLRTLCLYENNLEGTLPSELGRLKYISVMDIHGNRLSGPIPTQLGMLADLQFLALDENRLSGSIPSQLMILTRLSTLDLTSNLITGTIHTQIGLLSTLFTIDFADNRLKGTIPSQIGLIDSLTAIKVSLNELTGSIPTQLAKLRLLEDISLNSNRLHGTVPSGMFSLPQLAYMYLQQNTFSGTIPSQLSQSTPLYSFLANNNRFEGSIPDLVQLTNLRFLSLHANQLAGTIPEFNSSVLILVTLHQNNLRGTIPHSLPASLYSTKPSAFMDSIVLTLAGNFLSCEIPSVGIASGLHSRSFIAPGNAFEEDCPDYVPDVECDARFLFLPRVQEWIVQVSILGIGLVLLILVITAVVGWSQLLCAIALARRSVSSDIRSVLLNPASHLSDPMLDQQAERGVMGFLALCTRHVGWIALTGLVVGIPIFATEAHLYECGHVLANLTIAHTIGSHLAQWVIGGASCVSACVTTVLVYRLVDQGVRSFASQSTHESRPLPSEPTHVTSVLQYFWRYSVYTVTLLVLNIPAVFYVILQSVPHNNSLMLSDTTLSVLKYAFPILLMGISTFIVPWLCAWVAQPWSAENTVSVLELRLLSASRLLIVVVMPVAAILMFDDGCYQQWRHLWQVCDGKRTDFDFHGPLSGMYLLTTEEVCTPNYRAERCSRRVVELTSEFISRKLAVQATILPLLVLLIGGIPLLRARTSRFTSRLFDIGAIVTVQGLTLVELAVIYSFVAPFVSVMVFVTLVTSNAAQDWVMYKGYGSEREHEAIPFDYLLLSVFLQGGLVSWFFYDNGFESRQLVVIVQVFLAVGALVWSFTKQVRAMRPESQSSSVLEQMLMDGHDGPEPAEPGRSDRQ